MSRLMTLMLGLSLALGTVSISFADEIQKGPVPKANVVRAHPLPPHTPHKPKKPQNPNTASAKTKVGVTSGAGGEESNTRIPKKGGKKAGEYVENPSFGQVNSQTSATGSVNGSGGTGKTNLNDIKIGGKKVSKTNRQPPAKRPEAAPGQGDKGGTPDAPCGWISPPYPGVNGRPGSKGTPAPCLAPG